VTSGFCHEVAENCVLLDYDAASSGNSFPMYWEPIGPIFKGQES